MNNFNELSAVLTSKVNNSLVNITGINEVSVEDHSANEAVLIKITMNDDLYVNEDKTREALLSLADQSLITSLQEMFKPTEIAEFVKKAGFESFRLLIKCENQSVTGEFSL
mgnify:CR=1 FL=1|tara:strand:+ start:42 stop:374 length:333 start_codon:yes stop_codon:yes gene_type:complete